MNRGIHERWCRAHRFRQTQVHRAQDVIGAVTGFDAGQRGRRIVRLARQQRLQRIHQGRQIDLSSRKVGQCETEFGHGVLVVDRDPVRRRERHRTEHCARYSEKSCEAHDTHRDRASSGIHAHYASLDVHPGLFQLRALQLPSAPAPQGSTGQAQAALRRRPGSTAQRQGCR